MGGSFATIQCLLLVLLAFALLIGNAAGGFASGLARGLAFAAAAVIDALVKIAGLESFDSLHETKSPFCSAKQYAHIMPQNTNIIIQQNSGYLQGIT